MKYAVVSYYVGETGDTELWLYETEDEAIEALNRLWEQSYNLALEDEDFDEDNSYHEDYFAVVAWKDKLYRYFEVVKQNNDEVIGYYQKNAMCTENILESNQKKITDLWNGIINMLPPQPRSYDAADDPGFWTNGEEILCPSEAEMEMVYEFLNDIFREFGNYTLITGWYSPEEDARSGEQDDCTGFNYIRLE